MTKAKKPKEWGEKKGDSVTFTEYLVQRGEAYLRELPVRWRRDARSQPRQVQPRIEGPRSHLT